MINLICHSFYFSEKFFLHINFQITFKIMSTFHSLNSLNVHLLENKPHVLFDFFITISFGFHSYFRNIIRSIISSIYLSIKTNRRWEKIISTACAETISGLIQLRRIKLHEKIITRDIIKSNKVTIIHHSRDWLKGWEWQQRKRAKCCQL